MKERLLITINRFGTTKPITLVTVQHDPYTASLSLRLLYVNNSLNAHNNKKGLPGFWFYFLFTFATNAKCTTLRLSCGCHCVCHSTEPVRVGHCPAGTIAPSKAIECLFRSIQVTCVGAEGWVKRPTTVCIIKRANKSSLVMTLRFIHI